MSEPNDDEDEDAAGEQEPYEIEFTPLAVAIVDD